MKKKFVRLISAVLSAAMTLTAVPLSAFAEGEVQGIYMRPQAMAVRLLPKSSTLRQRQQTRAATAGAGIMTQRR